MGLDTASAMFLCAAKSLGLDFSHTAMIGRQAFFPDPSALQRIFSVRGIPQAAEEFLRRNSYSEPFFSLLGAAEVVSLDYSDYEGAGLVHDMNQPIPSDWREKFSVVHDGGTIEHVFNAPQAFQNCMEMVRIGGHFTQVNVANNFMGHGFWQFSPELLFRVFSPANGFRIQAVLLHEVVPGGAWYLLRDPAEMHARVELCNNLPTYVLTIAQRMARTDIFHPAPQQSDYVESWNQAAGASPPAAKDHPADVRSGRAGSRGAWRQSVPEPIRRVLRTILRRRPPADAAIRRGFDAACYRRIPEDALLRGELT